jgi:hypothetical protein
MLRALVVVSSMGVLLTVSGCGVTPARVDYRKYDSAEQSDGIQFRLRRSVIIIGKNEQGVLVATASPTEFDVGGQYSQLYSMIGRDDWRSTTQIKIKYIDNTKEPDQINFTTTDNVSSTIDKIGQLGTALAPVVAGLVSGTQKDLVGSEFKSTKIDPGVASSTQWQSDILNSGYCMRVTNVVEEPGVTIDKYFSTRRDSSVRDFPAPACVTAQVEMAQCNQITAATLPANAVVLPVTYASSSLVMPVPIPSSGSIKLNSICGADVTADDKEDRSDVLTYLAKAATSASDISAAWKKAKSGK